MNDKINQFLDSVCACIKYKPVHKDIRDELAIHVNELKDDFLKEAQTEEAALDMAISAMGDCRDIGKQLNKRHKPETEWLLIGLTAIIAAIGGVVMFTSSQLESSMLVNTVNFEKYLIFVILGIAIMIGLNFFDYTRLKRLSWPIYLLSLTLLIAIPLFCRKINGSMFFLIGDQVISTQLTTLFLMISFAGFIDRARGKGMAEILKLCFLASISVLPVLMLSLAQALTLLIGYAVLIITSINKGHFSGSRKRQFILLGILSCLGSLSLFKFIFSAQYRIARILSFMTRGRADPTGDGYQQVMANKWLMASNLFGSTTEKISGGRIDTTLPGSATYYALVNIFATLGWVIGITLIIIIAAYIARLFATTKKIKNDYGFYLSLAACTVLAVQFIMGILVNFNLLPPAGVYIPFISYGGFGYICSMALIGLVLSVWRRNNIMPSCDRSDCNKTQGFFC